MSLPSWNDGAARTAILEYIERTTSADGPEHVPVEERVAVFDNDGTLWCERPTYLQASFIVDRLREQAAVDPGLAEEPVVAALLAGDLAAATGYGLEAVLEVLLDAHAGMTTDEFAAAVAAWATDFRHPRFAVAPRGLVYTPMLELMDLLRSHAFRVFIVTGGGVDFLRPLAADLYGVCPDDVVGSAVEVTFERRDGAIVLVRTAALSGSPNEGAPKVSAIHARVGVRPVVAAGNSAGDREMLEFAHTGHRPSLCLVIDHDDPDREYAYPGAALTDPHAEPIAATAERFGWTVVHIRSDWSRVFA